MANLTNDIILRETGREYGPDFMLNVEKGAINGPTITPESSVTEVLNIVGYLCNTSRAAAVTIKEEGSIDKLIYGEHDNTGIYTAAGLAGAPGAPGAGAALGTLYISAPNQLIDLDSLDTPAGLATPIVAGAVIPQGILRRTQDVLPLHAPVAPIDISQVAVRKVLLSDCVKQMINILTKTREIFGPKGWTALFNQVKGGGAGSKHAKRTHRQHRRRYSSKHY
jgi:hypothetical protein